MARNKKLKKKAPATTRSKNKEVKTPLAPSTSKKLPTPITSPVPRTRRNLPRATASPVPSTTRNLPRATRSSVPTTSRNVPRAARSPVPSTSKNIPKATRSPEPSTSRGLPRASTSPVPSTSRGLPGATTSSVPSTSRDTPRVTASPVPGTSRDIPRVTASPVPGTSRDLRAKINRNRNRSVGEEGGNQNDDVGDFVFTPIEFDFSRALLPSGETGPVQSIMSKDKVYRSKIKNPSRAELYNSLLRYIRLNSMEDLRKSCFAEMDEAKFRSLTNCSHVFETLRKHVKQKKIVQQLTKYITKHYDEDFNFKTNCFLQFQYTINTSKKLWWRAYVLRNRKDNTDEENLDLKRLTKRVNNYVQHEVANIGSDSVKYVVHYAVMDVDTEKFGFIGITRQEVISPARRKNGLTCFAFKDGSDSLYAYGIVYERLIQIVCNGLGFGKFVSQSLYHKNLVQVVKISSRVFQEFDMEGFKRKVDEEESEMNSKGIRFLDPIEENAKEMQCAIMFNERDDPNMNRCYTIESKVPHKTSTGEIIPNKFSKVTTTIHLKDCNPDEYFAQLYREGFITDLTPYLKLKYKRANHLVLEQ